MTPSAIAAQLTAAERRCVLNWGDGKTPIPDSIWHGRWSHLKRHRAGSATSFELSPTGLAVRACLLRAKART